METDRRTAAGIFVVAFAAYAYFFGGSGFNQNAHFDQARAMVERGVLSIDAYAGNTYDVSVSRGHVWPNKAPGTSLLAAIAYFPLHAIERAAGLDPGAFPLLLVNLYVVTVLVCGVPGALIPAILFLHARRRGAEPRWALTIALLAAFGTPLFAYSTMLFLHVPSAAAMLIAYDALFRERARPALAGAAIGLAGLINYLCIPAALILAIPARRQIVRYALAGLPFALLLGAYHAVAFGSPFELPLSTENPAFLDQGALLGVLAGPKVQALWGVTFSPYRGLFFLSPLMLAAAIGCRSRTIGAIALGFLAFNVTFNGWHGGYAIGPRYLLPILPLLALGLIHMPRAIVLPLGAASLMLNLLAVAVDPQPPDSMRNPIFDYAVPSLVSGEPGDRAPEWLRHLYTGHVATNRVAADEPLPFKRHPPGSPESEWASFNLGETLLPQGHWSTLLPVLLWMIGGAVYLGRRASAVRSDA